MMQSMNTETSIVYMVPDHKQKVLQMRFCKGQVDYCGKKVMNLLGMMEVRRKVDGEFSGFEYSFVDYVVKGYSGQYQVQVADVFQWFFLPGTNSFRFQYEHYNPR